MFKADTPGGLVNTGSILAHSVSFFETIIGARALVFGAGTLKLTIFHWKDSPSFSGFNSRGITLFRASFNLAGSAGDVS